MAGSLTDKYGYDTDEIDERARDVLTVLDELEAPPTLMLLALCRAITITAIDEELDVACIMIDEMREAENEVNYEFDEEDDEQD